MLTSKYKPGDLLACKLDNNVVAIVVFLGMEENNHYTTYKYTCYTVMHQHQNSANTIGNYNLNYESWSKLC